MTTPLDTAPIVARLAASTPGRWIWWMSEEPPFAIGAEPASYRPIAYTYLSVDAEFVCAAPTDIAALLGEIERLQTSVENVLMTEMRASRARAREGPAAARIEQTTQWTIERIRHALGLGRDFLREE